MTPDYSDPAARESAALRTLCALIDGRHAAPWPREMRGALLDVARAHRVDRLAARGIGARGDDLEAWFADPGDELKDERTCAVLDAVRGRELHMVLDALSAVHGADPIVFKGAALAYSHYPQPWLRPRLDADILISPPAVAPAFVALEALGYERALTTPGALVLSQASLSRTDRFGIEHALDLHWKIANWHVVAAALSHAEIAARAVPLPALGPHARAAADRDALLLACLHRAAHHRDSSELLWIYDIHLIARRLPPADWAAAIATAQRAQVRALCARGLALAMEWFDAPVPLDVMRALETPDGAAAEPSAVYLSNQLRLVDGLMSDLRALPPPKRARLLVEHLFPPAAYMRQRYNATSRTSLALWYVRRIASGLPKWFAARGNS